MYTLGGYLGQLLAGFNLALVIITYAIVYYQKFKASQKQQQDAREKRLQELHRRTFKNYFKDDEQD